MVAANPSPPKLALGQVYLTPGAIDALSRAGEWPDAYLARHAGGDWGDVDPEDWWLNDRALVEGARVLSAYRTALAARLWVITEADRSATTLLLPEEY